MKYEKRDRQSKNPCKKKCKFQYIEKDKKGKLWQFCVHCDRKLLVR